MCARDCADASWPDIGAHRLIGDHRSAALVTPNAEIDWWCAPRFDSDPVLWSLLDREGGRARFDAVEPLRASGEAAARTAWTEVRTPAGRLMVRDGLVDGRIIRVVRALDGPLDVEHECASGGFETGHPCGSVRSRLRAAQDQPVALALTADGVDMVDADVATAALDRSEAAFRRSSVMRRARRHDDRLRDAFAVTRLSSYGPTGAVVASVSTSLPEALGADRQFDYRYAWLRDGSLAASVAALDGRLDLASRHLQFVEGLGDRVFEAPLFTVDGGPVPRERTVDAVEGWRASRPVRVGNAAAKQVQYDALGFLVEAVSTYTRAGGRLSRRMWRLVRKVADRCASDDPADTNGIWELREAGPLLAADIGRWLALERAVRVARRRRPWTRRRRWIAAAERLRSRALDAIEPDGRVPQKYGGDPAALDASALLMVMFGVLDTRDPRAGALVDAHIAGLGEGPHLRRYASSIDDGFSGTDATFVPCSWWAVTALAALGRVDEAQERSDELCRELPRLLPEEFDPITQEGRGNAGLVWAHAEMARALRVLEVARIRARWGRLGVFVDQLRRRASMPRLRLARRLR